MNVKRFTGRTSRDALNLVRQAFGDDAVVLSTKPCAEGVEILAMAPDGLQQIERLGASAPSVKAPAARAAAPAAPAAPARQAAPARSNAIATRAAAAQRAPQQQPAAQAPARAAAPAAAPVDTDVAQLAMSTLSFQDYVRERMLKRRQAALREEPTLSPESQFAPESEFAADPRFAADVHPREPAFEDTHQPEPEAAMPPAEPARVAQVHPLRREARAAAPARQAEPRREPPVLRDAIQVSEPVPSLALHAQDTRREQAEMMNELRSMKGMIEERFGALAFMEKLQRQPQQARLSQKLLDCGFSPALIRKLVDSLPRDVADESAWSANVLERNLPTGEAELPLEDQGGVYAMIGSTGVGKTTSTAKLAAAFAAKHGANHLGLITLDAYRVGAHEQLRTYGRILGVPVHSAHDRASLEDLLDLLSGKKMVLIDTAGMAQRDSRTRELLDMLQHRSINKLLVVNAASQGETIEDVMVAWRASLCKGVILSKMDEAVKLAPALDALIRHKLKVLAVANGQRVPEDWHRLSSHALVHRALRATGGTAYRMDASDVNLVFAGLHTAGRGASSMHA